MISHSFLAPIVSFSPKGIFWERFRNPISSIFEPSGHGEMKALYTWRHFSDAFRRSRSDLHFKNADTPGEGLGTDRHVLLPTEGVPGVYRRTLSSLKISKLRKHTGMIALSNNTYLTSTKREAPREKGFWRKYVSYPQNSTRSPSYTDRSFWEVCLRAHLFKHTDSK